MGQLAISAGVAVAGGVAGFFIAGPAGVLTGASLGWAVGSAVGGVIYGSKQMAGSELGPQLGELSVQSSALGAAIPLVFGRWEVAGNLIWIGELTINGNPVNNDTGQAPQDDGDGSGKGGGGGGAPGSSIGSGGSPGDPVFKCSFAVAICEGPIDSPLKVYADGKLIADYTDSGYFSGPDFENLITVYKGDEVQLPDPTIEAAEGVGNVPAFRGTAYLVFRNLPLANFGNRIPNITVEVLSTATQAFPITNVSLPSAAPVADNHVLSKVGPFIYVKHSNFLSKVDRNSGAVILSRDLKTAIEGFWDGIGAQTSTIVSHGAITLQTSAKLIVSETEDSIYVAAEQGSYTFIVEVDPISLLPRLTSYPNKQLVTGGSFDGLTTGTQNGVQRLYTADNTGAKIRCFTRGTILSQFFLRDGPNASAIPGNFCYVPTLNAAYMISYLSGNADLFYISKITEDGYVTHYTVNGTDFRCKNIAFDNLENAFICGGGDSYIIKVDKTTPSTVLASVASRSNGSLRSCFVAQRRVSGRAFLTQFSGNIYLLNTEDLSTLKAYSNASWGSPTLNGMGRDFDRNSIWVADPAGTRLRELKLDRLGPETVTLDNVCNAICTRAGFTSAQLDTTGLTDEINGYAIGRQMNARAAIDPLQKAYLFDVVETSIPDGYGMKFVKQGAIFTVTIPEDDLGVTDEIGEPVDKVVESIIQEAEVPRRVVVRYGDTGRQYEAGTQQAQRRQTGVSTITEIVIEIPLAITDEVAKQLAELHLYQAWTERKSIEINIGPKWIYLDGADVIRVLRGTISYIGRIINAEDGGNFVRKLKIITNNSIVHTPSAHPAAVPLKPIHTLRPIAPTYGEFWDTGIMRAADNNTGVYFSAAPVGAGQWGGATVMKSLDNQAFAPTFHVQKAATMGVVEVPLPIESVRHTVWDHVNTMRVRMIYGTLSSKTQLEVLNGANLCIVGKEIIQFMTATELSTGVYDLSEIIRARFGTDWDIPNRKVGEPFVLVDVATMRRIVPAVHELNQTKPVRIATFRQKVDSAMRKDITNEANGLKPLSPCKFRGGTPSGGDFELYWLRRTRIGGEQVDSVLDVPLGEETEAYEIDVYSDSDYTNLVRTISVGAPPDLSISVSVSSVDQSYNRAAGSFIDDGYIVGMQLFVSGMVNAINNNYSKIVYVEAAKIIVEKRGTDAGGMITEGAATAQLRATNPGARYTAAQQSADGVDPTIYCKVYQISAIVGRGFPESGSFLNTSL